MTITTVGYGDFYPVTAGGRITAIFIMVAGVGLIGALLPLTFFSGEGKTLNGAATLAGALVAALRAPLFAALFTLVLVQSETAPVVAVAVMISALMTAVLAMRETRQQDSGEVVSGGGR